MDTVASAAIGISVFSLAVSVVALIMKVRHDHKSVRPIPQIVFGDYEDKLYVAVENAGIGPFVIRQATVESSLPFEPRTSVIGWMPELPRGIDWTTFVERLAGRAIPAQQRLTLLELNRPTKDQPGFPASSFDSLKSDIRVALGYLTVVLRTEDIYGREVPEYRRSLNWFHRLIMHSPGKAAELEEDGASTPEQSLVQWLLAMAA